MQTVNISLTSEQTKLVDTLISRFGYANRSEFFRSLLRVLRHQPEVATQADFLPFQAPNSCDANQIINSFRRTKKYSKSFLKDLATGLRDSNYFRKK